MVASVMETLTTVETSTATESRIAHWRQLRRFSTIEGAEEMIADLRSQGLEAKLSLIDGLCVLARREV